MVHRLLNIKLKVDLVSINLKIKRVSLSTNKSEANNKKMKSVSLKQVDRHDCFATVDLINSKRVPLNFELKTKVSIQRTIVEVLTVRGHASMIQLCSSSNQRCAKLHLSFLMRYDFC